MSPVEVSGAAVEQAAIEVARRRKVWAGVAFALAGLFALPIGMTLVASASPDLGGIAVGGGMWIAILVACGLVLLRRGRKLLRTGELAATDPRMRWLLVDGTIVPVNARGMTQGEHAFQVMPKTRAALTAGPTLPRARALRR